MRHASHPDIVKRLKQAHGYLAAKSAVHTAKRALIQDHMAHCIADSVAAGGTEAGVAMREFKALAKYL